MVLALLLAVSISSPEIGTFFDLNGMVPGSVPANRTFGSADAEVSTHRLDPQEQAAVIAVFEAYFERVYYGNAGLSNEWDAVQYGPTCRYGTGLDRFQFNTRAPDGRSSFHYEPDTNRVIRTRRLAEYGNIRALCYLLHSESPGEFGGGPDAFLSIYRPLWTRTDGDGNVLRPRWSSSLFDGLETEHGRPETEFPEIGWCDKGTFLCRGSAGGAKDPYYWANLTLIWNNLAVGGADFVNWAYPWSDSGCMVEDMMWRIQFGDPPHGNDMQRDGYLPQGYALPSSTVDVLNDRRVEGVTNTTRRLVSDNLAGLGIGLSAIDRSYCEVAHAIPAVVSNFYASAARTYSADFPIGTVSFDWDSSLGAWVHVVDEIDVPPLDTVIYESSSVSNVEATSYGDFCVYANPARLSASVGSFVTPDPEAVYVVRWESDSDLVDEFRDLVLQLVPDNGEAVVSLVDISVNSRGDIHLLCAYWTGSDFSPFNQYLGPLQTAYSNINVSAAFSSSTGYEFGRTFRTAQLDRRTGFMPYPGDFSRVDTDAGPVLWTMFGRGFKGGYDKDHEFAMKSGTSMRSVAYETSPGLVQAFDYSCARGSFHSVQTAFSAADGHYASLVSSCMQKFGSSTGLGFWDPLSMLDIVSAGVPDALSHVVFSGVLGLSLTPLCGAQASGPVVFEHVVFEVRDGAISDVHAMYCDYDSNAGGYFEGTPPHDIYSVSVVLREDNTKVRDGHEPANHDFHGAAVAGRMTSLSKVNWKWRALRREK